MSNKNIMAFSYIVAFWPLVLLGWNRHAEATKEAFKGREETKAWLEYSMISLSNTNHFKNICELHLSVTEVCSKILTPLETTGRI